MRRILHALFGERRCLVCSRIFAPSSSATDAAAPTTTTICPGCLAMMPQRVKGYCPSCGELSAWPTLPVAPCGACLTKKPVWDKLLFYGAYEGALRRLAILLKFNDHTLCAHAAGLLLASHPACGSLAADAIIPMPLHHKRLQKRGYNQALEIARPFAAHLGIPLCPDFLSRTRETAPQVGSSRSARQRNTLGAFAATQGVQGKHIVLLDDVITTGSTMESASLALKAQGAQSVTAVALARNPLHRQKTETSRCVQSPLGTQR